MTPTRDSLGGSLLLPSSLTEKNPSFVGSSESGSALIVPALLGKVGTVGKFFIVGIGGFTGSILRFWLATYVGQRMGTRFPYGTFIINVTGSFLIGFVMTVLTEKTHLSPNWRYLIPIGFIGGYTTFSTFEFETLRAVQDGQFTIGTLNIVLSVLVGFLMVWTGAMVGKTVA
jgi:fluoride exporter